MHDTVLMDDDPDWQVDEQSVGEPEWASTVPDPITDGSQALAHDGYDVQVFTEALHTFPRLAQAVQHAGQKLVTAPALLRDVFLSFYKRAPQITPSVPVTPAYEPNRQILAQIMATGEWQQVRQSGTAGDPLMAAMATISVVKAVLDSLDSATITRINTLHELESGAARLFAQAESLVDLAQQAQGDRAAALFVQAKKAQNSAERLRHKTENVASAALLDETMEDEVRRAARQAGVAADQEIGQMQAAIAAFTGNGNAGGGLGHGTALSPKDTIALAGAVGKSRRLQEIAALCGRMTRIALDVQRTKIRHTPDEIATVCTGRDISHLLPGELALLADPDTEDLFALRFAEGTLMQYALVAYEKQGQGPIIVALDNSNSMTEVLNGITKEAWSKAVTLALLAIARKQGRDMQVIHFSSADQLTIHHFPKGKARHVEVMACIEHFFDGGTAFEPWMRAALTAVDDARFDKADVICVSDGLASIDPQVQAEWQRRRKERGMRAFAVLIGTDDGAGLIASMTDAVMTLDNLHEDNAVLRTIFSI